VVLLDTPGLAWRGGRILSDTIEPMPTSGVRGQTGDRENLQVPAAELVERAKTEGSGNRVLRGGFTSLIVLSCRG
jgi:hypothetical protein